MSLELPIRIGVAGLGRLGRFHVERLSLRRDFRVVALHDVDAVRRDDARGVDCEFFTDWDRFLQYPELDAVLLATPVGTRATLATDALAAGKHVVVETPLANSVDEADRMLTVARECNCVLCVVNHRRAEDDFAAAIEAFRGGEIGELRAVQFVAWDRVDMQDGPLPGETGDALIDLGARRIDQLLNLVGLEPRQVFAQSPATTDRCAFQCIVEFADGVTAHVDVDRNAVAPLHTGWVFSGTRGGYANFRRYTLTDDGEIFDVPVSLARSGGESTYDAMLAELCEGRAIPAATAIAHTVVILIEVMRESTERKSVVEVRAVTTGREC